MFGSKRLKDLEKRVALAEMRADLVDAGMGELYKCLGDKCIGCHNDGREDDDLYDDDYEGDDADDEPKSTALFRHAIFI